MEVKFVTATDKNSKLRFTPDSDRNKLENIKAQLTPQQQKKIIIDSARPYLADEVSKKIKDTLLGLFSSHRNKESALSSYSQSLFTRSDQPILVLLFLERNTQLNQEQFFKPLASNLKLAIEQKLRFLGNLQVDVVNTLTLPSTLEIKVSARSPT